MAVGFRNNLVLAGIGSLALAALAPLPTLAAPGITLQGSFTGTNGDSPQVTLTAAGNGIYYGTTNTGGANGSGAIFKFDSATGSITLQDSFNFSNGDTPVAALTSAGNGIYYGTTYQGGANFSGTIYSFDSATGSITLQASFTGSNGSAPNAALTAAGNGIYYGTTRFGGANSAGGIFKFDSATGSITLQDSFASNGSNGANPEAALTAAGSGIYYGTADGGGANREGAIFKFDSATGTITLQNSFASDGSNGARPNSALTAAGNGIYYGTTRSGGANGSGAIFKFDSATGSITLQDSFDGSNGSIPLGELTAAGNGIYYGTTVVGGVNGTGAVFAFDAATGSITLQDSFVGSNGARPYAALTAARGGLYYGTTSGGGASSKGSIFAFDSGVRDSNPVPGPLPLMGAGAAFGWSRRLRRRIQAVRPVFPMGR
jgi:uncharacterized repeat protein (TIGR03803 family)